MATETNYTTPSKDWTPKMKRDFRQLVSDAWSEGYDAGKDKLCTGNGSVDPNKNKCDCKGCTAASYAQKKQAELTGVDSLKMAEAV